MGFWSRLRGHNKGEPARISTPDDSEIKNAMAKAKRANTRASQILNAAVKKQERDALFVRQVISDVLARTEKR